MSIREHRTGVRRGVVPDNLVRRNSGGHNPRRYEGPQICPNCNGRRFVDCETKECPICEGEGEI